MFSLLSTPTEERTTELTQARPEADARVRYSTYNSQIVTLDLLDDGGKHI